MTTKDMNINSFDELKIHPIYNKLINDYPIINKYSKSVNNVNIKLNYNNESISNTIPKETLIILIRFLVDLVEKSIRPDKVIISLLIYEIILNHENFLLENKKFLLVCLNKIEEFKKSNYVDFDDLKLYNNNINPLDTIFEKFTKLNEPNVVKIEKIINITRDIPAEILSKYKLIYDSEINNKIAAQKLKLKNSRNFNFKTNNNTLNEEEFNLSFSIYLDILLSTNTTRNIVVVYILIFELFINNIDFIKKDELLKSFFINKTKELIKSNFSDFESFKVDNYNKNPLETIINLIRFYC
jgi:hypothetical protein